MKANEEYSKENRALWRDIKPLDSENTRSVDEIVITKTMNVGGNVFVHKGAGKLVLHDGIKLWESMFFQSSFGEIVFPSDVKSIPKHAFEMAHAPYVLEIPEGVEEIGECAFFYAEMEEVTLPTTIREIGNCAFSDMPHLKKMAHPVFCCSIVSPDNSGKFNS